MPNAKTIIQSHNKRILDKGNPNVSAIEKACNCQKRNECPLDGACLTKNLIYEAKVTTESSEKLYIGSTGCTFKSRYSTHKHSFKSKGDCETELSKHIWSLKDNTISYNISWKIVKQVNGGKPAANKTCTICNAEKIEIARANKRNLLNKRSEPNSKCPHFKGLYFKRIVEEQTFEAKRKKRKK